MLMCSRIQRYVDIKLIILLVKLEINKHSIYLSLIYWAALKKASWVFYEGMIPLIKSIYFFLGAAFLAGFLAAGFFTAFLALGFLALGFFALTFFGFSTLSTL